MGGAVLRGLLGLLGISWRREVGMLRTSRAQSAQYQLPSGNGQTKP